MSIGAAKLLRCDDSAPGRKEVRKEGREVEEGRKVEEGRR
jgi:hypothetical protein